MLIVPYKRLGFLSSDSIALIQKTLSAATTWASLHVTPVRFGGKRNQTEHEAHADSCAVGNNVLHIWLRNPVSSASTGETADQLVSLQTKYNLRHLTFPDTGTLYFEGSLVSPEDKLEFIIIYYFRKFRLE